MSSFDFAQVQAPFRMQPGLRRLEAGAAQVTPALPGARHLREKLAVLGSFSAQALLSTPGFDAAPVLAAIAGEAARASPAAFVVESADAEKPRLRAPLIGWALVDGEPRGDGDPSIGAVLSGLPPEQRAEALLSLAFEEDFAVIDGASTTLPWLAVCLPSRWAPEEKIGRHFAEVHAPVADNRMLIGASASLAHLVTGDERWERHVWTVTPDPRLHQHPARGRSEWPDDAASVDDIAAIAFFRTERQTFIPIAGRGQAVFTIRVESRPLSIAVTGADAARRLHDAIASMSPAVLAYRQLERVRDRLLSWLDRRAAAEPR